MTTITYIYHSGFVLETPHALLVFDYWKDPAGVMPGYMKKPQHVKPVYVFSSHFHEDHFNRDIFKWRCQDGFPSVTYILSKDILKHRRASREEADVWLAKGGTWHDDLVRVVATGSNDSGVSWIVDVDGMRLFHAGDLCNWYARFLSDGNAEGEIFSDDFGQYVNPVAEEKRYLGELKDIRKQTAAFDVVMFPVDGRIGNGYTLGARQFIARFRVGLFVPMHFVMSGFESAWRMAPFCAAQQIEFWKIKAEGETMTI